MELEDISRGGRSAISALVCFGEPGVKIGSL